MVIVLHDLFILQQKSEVIREPVQALIFTRPCINFSIYMVQHWPATQEHVLRFVHCTIMSGFPLFLDLN